MARWPSWHAVWRTVKPPLLAPRGRARRPAGPEEGPDDPGVAVLARRVEAGEAVRGSLAEEGLPAGIEEGGDDVQVPGLARRVEAGEAARARRAEERRAPPPR